MLAQPHCFGAAARDAARPCRNPALRGVAYPRPLDAFIWPNADCAPLRKGYPIFNPCEFGVSRSQAKGTIAVVGDSHAVHWRATLEVVAEVRRWRGISVTRAGCPFSTAIPPSAALGPEACAKLHDRTIGWLARHPEVDTVFVSNSAQPGYGGGPEHFGAMLDRLPASVKRVYVLRDIPKTTTRAMDCVRARRGSCSFPRSAALFPDPGAAAAAARGPRMAAIDMSDFFCGPSRCFPVVGGAYVYKDDNHMNAVFAMSLGPYLLRALGG